jgi:hypothetical protein
MASILKCMVQFTYHYFFITMIYFKKLLKKLCIK